MINILLASHKRLALGLKDTLEMFLGKCENIVAVCAYEDASEDHRAKIQQFIDSVEEDKAVIFTDIYGGSVNQQVCELVIASNKAIPIVTSMNLPIVLSLALSNEKMTPAFIEQQCVDCIPRVVVLKREEEGELDEFFE